MTIPDRKPAEILRIHMHPDVQGAFRDLRGAIDERWALEVDKDHDPHSAKYHEAVGRETLEERHLIETILRVGQL